MPRGYPQADANPLREIFEKGACAYSKLPVEYSNVANDATETVAWLSGRASPSHGGGHRFKSCSDHHESKAPRKRGFLRTYQAMFQKAFPTRKRLLPLATLRGKFATLLAAHVLDFKREHDAAILESAAQNDRDSGSRFPAFPQARPP